MNNGWQNSAKAWIADMGDHGDFGRRYVLDPVMLPRALQSSPSNAIDIGCGEGRFCRMLAKHGVHATGVDPTPALVDAARRQDPQGTYIEAGAEKLPEMVRVLKPGGRLLIANLNSFNSACADRGWVKDDSGHKLHYPIDHYLSEGEMWIEYRGIRIVNFHRPLSVYMRLLLIAGLRLTHFDEPSPIEGAPARAGDYRRVPWFLAMEWKKL